MRESSPDQLSARCRNTQPDGSHEPFCFELFRRAIVEGSSLCWHYLHNQYYSLVRYWISLRATLNPDTIDDLTQEAFTAFWRFYTPDRLARADGLGGILCYLKSCAASVVAQAYRKADRGAPELEWDESVVDVCVSTYSAEASAFQHLTAEHLWAAIEAHCSDDRERLLARLTLVAGLKPRHIIERFPGLFSDVSEVYRIKRNLVDRLRRDPDIEGMCENGRNERLMG